MHLATPHIQSAGILRKPFSQEEIKNLSSLGDVLRQIRSRLKSEGVSIEDARQEIFKKDPNYIKYEIQRTKRKTIQE